jgi:hypothetical protein
MRRQAYMLPRGTERNDSASSVSQKHGPALQAMLTDVKATLGGGRPASPIVSGPTSTRELRKTPYRRSSQNSPSKLSEKSLTHCGLALRTGHILAPCCSVCRSNSQSERCSNPFSDSSLGRSVNMLGRFVLDGVLQRHDPRLERPTASQLQLEPLR